MITLLLILLAIVLVVIGLLIVSGAFVVSFGWAIVILADIVLGIWLIVKIIKKIFSKKKKK